LPRLPTSQNQRHNGPPQLSTKRLPRERFSPVPQTRHMIGAAELAAMKRRPLLINTARGGLVDEAAVGPALQAGHISGAGFDVTEVEPPPADHPFMALQDRPDFILPPHVAWASDEAVQALAAQLIDNVEAFQRGTAVHVVAA